MLWRTYSLNASACITAQQGEFLQDVLPVFHYFSVCSMPDCSDLLGFCFAVTLKFDFYNKKISKYIEYCCPVRFFFIIMVFIDAFSII